MGWRSGASVPVCLNDPMVLAAGGRAASERGRRCLGTDDHDGGGRSKCWRYHRSSWRRPSGVTSISSMSGCPQHPYPLPSPGWKSLCVLPSQSQSKVLGTKAADLWFELLPHRRRSSEETQESRCYYRRHNSHQPENQRLAEAAERWSVRRRWLMLFVTIYRLCFNGKRPAGFLPAADLLLSGRK